MGGECENESPTNRRRRTSLSSAQGGWGEVVMGVEDVGLFALGHQRLSTVNGV